MANERKIRFKFRGKIYEAGRRAYTSSRILLPDGTVLRAGGWSSEGLSLVPVDLRRVPSGRIKPGRARLVGLDVFAKGKARANIAFRYRGNQYEIPMRAYDDQLIIILPNGTILKAESWAGNQPPHPLQPLVLVKVPHAKAILVNPAKNGGKKRVRESRGQRLSADAGVGGAVRTRSRRNK